MQPMDSVWVAMAKGLKEGSGGSQGKQKVGAEDRQAESKLVHEQFPCCRGSMSEPAASATAAQPAVRF